jgi:hypothetical protein
MTRSRNTSIGTPAFDKGLIAAAFAFAGIAGIIGASVSGDIERNNRRAREAITEFDNAFRRGDYSAQDRAYTRMQSILDTTTGNPRDDISNIDLKYRDEMQKRIKYRQTR